MSSFTSYFSATTLCLAGALSILPASSACTETPKAKEEKECTPGAYVFCRCRDRQEGAKLCKDDAKSFGPCEPCETADNPEGELNPGEQPTPVQKDGGPINPPEQDSGPGNPNGSCGDGIVQSGEDCDDKNSDGSDGCDSSCKLSGISPPASNSCPGVEVHVWGGTHKPTLVAKTNGSGNRSVTPNCTGGPNPTTGAAAPDRIFKVVAHKTGTMQVVTSETDYNNFLFVSDACAADQNTWLKCVNDSGSVGPENMTFPVTAGVTYYVFVDGAGISENIGTFRVTFAIP